KKSRICLDFGDEGISRTAHANITYDHKHRKYYINHGGGQNLTYLNDMPVLQPVLLAGGEEMSISDTKLRFVPFCSEEFDWQET
ncbi:MAG: FHA domain-containing protein, partial [Mariprofundales bacterium]